VTISLTKASLIAALNVNSAGNAQVNATISENNNLAATTSSTTSISSFSVDEITKAIENVATLRANNGAETSRLQFAREQLQTNNTNLEAANSRIIDVDVAKESTAFARNSVLVQSGSAMLAQANGLSNIALNLLG
jgi:flagellin